MSEYPQSLTHSLKSTSNKIIKPKSGLNYSFNKTKSRNDNMIANQRIEAKQVLQANQRRIANEDLFDQFMEKVLSLPIHEVLEPVLRVMFRGDNCILWVNDDDEQYLYSPTHKIIAGYSNSMPGFVFKTQSVLQIKDASQCPKGFTIDPRISSTNSPHFFFPIANKAVIQVIRRSSSGGFNELDMESAQLLMHKFSIYGESLFSVSQLNKIALSLFKETPSTLDPYELIQKHFDVEKCEIWKVDPTKPIYQIYDVPSCDLLTVQNISPIAEEALQTRGINNISDPQEGAVLTATIEMNRREVWIGILQGRDELFNSSEEAQFNSLMPFLIKFIVGYGNESQQKQLANKLGDLLNIFSLIACTMNEEELERIINEQTPQIFECESVRYVVFNKKNMPKKNEMSLIVQSLMMSEPLIIDNPGKSKNYSPEMDSDNGQEPKSLISCAVKTNTGKLMGYICLFSKHAKSGFDTTDAYILQTICSFVATSVLHCKRLKKLKAVSSAICNSEDIPSLLKRIMNASDIKRICVYSSNPDWALVAHEGESADVLEEIKAIKANKDAGNVHFIQLTNAQNEEVGAFGFSGTLENAETYAKLIGTMINTNTKVDVQLSEIIDSAKADVASASSSIDLGENIYKHTFSVANLSPVHLYKVVFKIFNRLSFFEAYSITNLALFGFLRDYGLTKQSVNSFQFFASEILQTHSERVCTKQQLIAGCLAALFSDFTADSVLIEESSEAIVNISRAISILANDQMNIFKALGPNDMKIIWSMIVDLTVATDHAKHFEIIENARTSHEQDAEDESAEEKMSLDVLKLFVLCAKFAECCRENPQENMLRTLSANFWRRCDLSKTSLAGTKREDIKPNDSIKIMLEEAVKPAMDLLANIYPQLSPVFITFSSNLEKF